MNLKYLLVALALVAAGCSKAGVTDPSPGLTLYTLTGKVSLGTSSAGVNAATVRITAGPNAGMFQVTSGDGSYTLPGLTFAGGQIEASASGYTSSSRSLVLTQGKGTQTENFSIIPSTPWSQSGAGNTVFDMPTYFSRVRVVGTYTGYSTNFVMYVNGRLLVNELLGTGWGTTTYDGIALTTGGVVEVKLSTGVSWTLTEVR